MQLLKAYLRGDPEYIKLMISQANSTIALNLLEGKKLTHRHDVTVEYLEVTKSIGSTHKFRAHYSGD